MSSLPSSLEFLVVPKPKAYQLPPGHHSLDRWPLHGYGVTPATDGFFVKWPHLHPLNLPLWDVKEAFPPYDSSPTNRPDQVPPNNTWPVSAFYYRELRCANAWAVFTTPDLLDDGSLILGPCLFHQRHRHQHCPWRTTVVPLRHSTADKQVPTNRHPVSPTSISRSARDGPSRPSVRFSERLPPAKSKASTSSHATIVDSDVVLDSIKQQLAAAKEELAATRRSHEAAKQRASDRHERELQAARDQHEEELQEQREDHLRALQALRNQHAKSIKKLRDEHANELQRTRDRHAKKLQEARNRAARLQGVSNGGSPQDIEILPLRDSDLEDIKAELDKRTQALQATLDKIKEVVTTDI